MKQLIEDNPFYGKAGTIIGDGVWNNLPKKHQKLFKNKSNNSQSIKQDTFDKFMADMRAFNPFGEDRPVARHIRAEFDNIPNIVNNDNQLEPLDDIFPNEFDFDDEEEEDDEEEF